MPRLSLASLCFLLLAAWMPQGYAQQAPFEAGTHHERISPPLGTPDKDRISVTEFFWYGCGHCFTFEPVLRQWEKTLADDVELRGSPAIWNKLMEMHARIYYTARALDVLDKIHPATFQAINVDRNRLASESAIADLFAGHGVDREDFIRAFNSFGVSNQVKQANARARSAQITGTPELMVNGKYRISTRQAGSQADMLRVAEFLIARERALQGE